MTETIAGKNMRRPNWKGYPKKRCRIEGCKKRTRYNGYCRIHWREYL